MIVPPLPYSPPREKPRPVRTLSGPALVPFITQRKGEEAAPDNLVIRVHPAGPRLYYRDEDSQLDRPVRGVLWGRCGFNPLDDRQMPTGEPEWKLMHPYRQMLTMQTLHCQVCARPARTPLGVVFLTGPRDEDPAQPEIHTKQPPVCVKHARAAAALCPHLAGDPMVFLARSAPLYGVHGTIYGLDAQGDVHVVAQPDHALPFGHPNLATTLATQLIRRITSFRVLGVEELVRELRLAT
ncbi:hypothetical protein [Streptomyces coelicoflavus]|uniref:hypothetical protein n=1 Tax=Streptomyces coelicoflavus TaxID=285562 RepID=UPI0036A31860